MKEFKELIENCKNTSKPTLLLGNGFSQSLSPNFKYTTLLDVATSKLGNKNLSQPLVKIFEELETSDFEKVLAYLNIAEKIIKHYNYPEMYKTINTDLNQIRETFVNSLTYIHPSNQAAITDDLKIKARSFLSNFGKIFTLNYDLLLYWIILAREISSVHIPHNDGFSRPVDHLVWNKTIDQDLFFLHGALHIFESEYIYKMCSKHTPNFLLAICEDKIKNGHYPKIVLEGKYQQKMQTINQCRFLSHAYENLENLSGTLFIVGASLNPNSDQHILDALKSSRLSSIFISFYDDDSQKNLLKSKDYLKIGNREVELFKSSSALDW